MEPTYLKHLSNIEPAGGSTDINSPYSFLEWKSRLPSLIEKEAAVQYNDYVVKWFQKNKQKPVSNSFLLRQKYLSMLDKLQLFFDSDEKNAWYKQVNLADEKELLLAIPYFAKKLKDISLYYLNLRKRLKQAKSKYNRVGSTVGLQQEIYKYLLETFSSDNNELTPYLQKYVPSAEDLQQHLTVQIEELYDDKHYFDISPTQPLSGYFDLLNDATSKFLSTKGIVLSSSDWLFNSFDVSMTPDNFATTFSQMTGILFETTDAESYTNFVQKYLAENKYFLTFLPQITSVTTSITEINQGNNNFYYPYGKSSTTYFAQQQLPLLALSSVYLENATAGNTLADSDTIIVKYGNQSKAAWLRNVEYETAFKTVKAVIKKDTTTRFIYPYPGYGLSGVNLPWTGPSFETNKEYNFLSIDLKANVNQAYWSYELPADSCNSILLNNTTLISSGANPHFDPRFADQFFIRQDRNVDTTAPYGEVDGAWLYRFKQTALPVSTIDDNVFLWPYAKLDTTQGYPDHFTKIDFAKACNSVKITDINKSSFVAGESISTADKIYKMSRYDDSIFVALECAWLSGSTVSLAPYRFNEIAGIEDLAAGGINGYKFTNQDGFAALFEAGKDVRFIWTGPTSKLADVFSSPVHKKDCLFSTNNPAVSAFEWPKCSCKQVYHAPFGHSFKTLEEGNYLADCIIEIPNAELANFDFGSWKDFYNRPILNPYSTATDVEYPRLSWYRTKTNFTWGGGKWIANGLLGASPFELHQGRSYIYKRANIKTQATNLPSYAVTYNYYSNLTKWVPAKLDGTTWVSAASGNSASPMTFYPGDIIRIERQDVTSHYLLSATYTENASYNKNSVWSTYDTVPFACSTSNTTTIHWPVVSPPFGTIDYQYPLTSYDSLSYIKGWSITNDQTREIQYITNQEVITFVPPEVGTYSVAVTGVKRNGDFICIPSRASEGIGAAFPHLSSTTYVKTTSAVGLSAAIEADWYTNNTTTSRVTYTVFRDVVTFTFSLSQDTVSDAEPNTYIPGITAVPQFQKNNLIETLFTTPTCGFLIEQPLYGWNYSTSKTDAKASGARPYWAFLDTKKTSTTRYKGIYSWGYPDVWIDNYLPNSNPVVSPIELNYGTIVDYERKGYPFTWSQPIEFQQYTGTTQWCLLSADLTQPSNFSKIYEIKQNIEPIAIPYNTPTDIQLSNLIDGAPLEIFYYALNSFTWPIEFTTVEDASVPTLSTYFTADAPWSNLTNRFNPTIANVPVIEETYSLKDVGGYFLPQRLGASQFVNKNFDFFIKSDTLSGTILTESVQGHIGGRGLTEKDQDTIFNWTENNQWIKESVTTGNLAGAVKKSLTKELQTFIPYQSNTDETCLGLVTPRSMFTPWGGPQGEDWMDKNNEPVGFTGVRNVSAWAASQVLKQHEKTIDNWASDVYGNQYGLFKETDNIPFTEHSNIFGELWIRTNGQQVIPAIEGLSAVYAPFAGLVGVNVYQELIENNIQKVDCYFDTLFIKTPSMCIFAKVDYNYDTSKIEMTFDDARWKELSNSYIFNQNWFIPLEKKLYSLYTKIEDNLFYPHLYELNLSTRNYKLAFKADNVLGEFIRVNSITDVSLNFNSTLNTFLLTYAGLDIQNKFFIADFYIKYEHNLTLTKVDLYRDLYEPEAINEPPMTLSYYLSTIDIGIEPFTVAVSALNNPTSFQLLNYSDKISLNMIDGYGVFTGQLSAGLYHVNYNVSNNTGSSIYCLTLSSRNRYPVTLSINISSEKGSELYNANNGAIDILCYKEGPPAYIQIAGLGLIDSKYYTVSSGETLHVTDLESSSYQINLIDQLAGTRTVNVFVGNEGYTNYQVNPPIIHAAVASSIEGYSMNTLFEI